MDELELWQKIIILLLLIPWLITLAIILLDVLGVWSLIRWIFGSKKDEESLY